MNVFFQYRYLLFLALFSPSLASAGGYLEISPSVISINTPTTVTRPLLVDLRLGYEKLEHQFELAVMTSVNDDNVNQLTIDVPSVVSAFYHYLPYPESRLKFSFILGVSRVEVESSFPGIAKSTDSFEGISYGIGFEEAFQSFPRLKLSLDWIQLYDGDQIDINAFSLGVHYDF